MGLLLGPGAGLPPACGAPVGGAGMLSRRRSTEGAVGGVACSGSSFSFSSRSSASIVMTLTFCLSASLLMTFCCVCVWGGGGGGCACLYVVTLFNSLVKEFPIDVTICMMGVPSSESNLPNRVTCINIILFGNC